MLRNTQSLYEEDSMSETLIVLEASGTTLLAHAPVLAAASPVLSQTLGKQCEAGKTASTQQQNNGMGE